MSSEELESLTPDPFYSPLPTPHSPLEETMTNRRNKLWLVWIVMLWVGLVAIAAVSCEAGELKITVRNVTLLLAAESDGAIAWHVEPPDARQHCEQTKDSLLFRAWEWPGHPEVVVLLIASDGRDIVTTRYVFPADSGDPPTRPLPDDLSVYVAELAEGLDDKQAVAKLFSNAIPRIWVSKDDPRELRGSGAIVLAVSTPISQLDSGPWQEFSRLLFQHLLHKLKIGGEGPLWAEAYRSVVQGLRENKP
jgi:hypothetical protein